MILSVKGLTKKYGSVTAIDKLDLDIREGEIFGLVGPDGAGKTTAIRLMLGILKPDAGSGRVGSFELDRQSESISTLTGYVSQRFSLYGELTVEENLALFADIYGVSENERNRRVDRLMQFSRLESFKTRLARNLSGGMKQKLALSCALIHTPKVLFLDEPTTGVDPLSRRDLWRLLFDLWQEGVTIIVSTPYMDEAERCSRIGFLEHGRLIALGQPDDLRAGFHGAILEIHAAEKFRAKEALAAYPYVRDVNLFGEGLHIIVDEESVDAAMEALPSAPIGVRSIKRIEPTMEDVFFQLVRSSQNGELVR